MFDRVDGQTGSHQRTRLSVVGGSSKRPAPPSFQEMAQFAELSRARSQNGKMARVRSRRWWKLGTRTG